MAESTPEQARVEASGPWPFITKRVFHMADGSRHLWSSRHHRKSLALETGRVGAAIRGLLRCLWMPGKPNWWIGTLFATGSILFALGSVLSLAPGVARAWSLDATQVNAVFFVGSIPFTVAAYLQLFQAANAGEFRPGASGTPHRRALFGWRPHDIGWLASALQFVGTLLFNINTFDAMMPSFDWLQEDLLVWIPDVVGSILFLASGYLGFIEACHAHWAWRPASLTWWIVFINLLGCAAFLASAAFAVPLSGSASTAALTNSLLLTLFGASAFLVGSLLMLPETAAEHTPSTPSRHA